MWGRASVRVLILWEVNVSDCYLHVVDLGLAVGFCLIWIFLGVASVVLVIVRRWPLSDRLIVVDLVVSFLVMFLCGHTCIILLMFRLYLKWEKIDISYRAVVIYILSINFCKPVIYLMTDINLVIFWLKLSSWVGFSFDIVGGA